MCPHLTPLLSTSIYTTALAKALISHQNQTKCACQNPKKVVCAFTCGWVQSPTPALMLGIPGSSKRNWLKSVGLITVTTSNRSKCECALPEGVRADTPLATPHGGASCRSPSLHSVSVYLISHLSGDILCLPVPSPGRVASKKAKCVSENESLSACRWCHSVWKYGIRPVR